MHDHENDKECVGCDLRSSFFDLCNGYSEKMKTPEFAFHMLFWIFKMIFDTAPGKKAAQELIYEALKTAWEWRLEERQEK